MPHLTACGIPYFKRQVVDMLEMYTRNALVALLETNEESKSRIKRLEDRVIGGKFD